MYIHQHHHLTSTISKLNKVSSTSPAHLNSLSLLLQGRISTSQLLQIHAQIFRIGANQNDIISTRLIGHYPPQFALRVFHHLQTPNIFPFNAIIRILSEQGFLYQVFSIFNTLKFQSLYPNDFTFSFLLKSCFRSTDVRNVQQIHTHIFKSGFDCNNPVCNGLLAVYAKGVRDLVSAHKLFDEMPQKGMVFSWTCLIAGYAHLNQSEKVLTLFLRMMREKLVPDDDTLVSILSACSTIEIHETERWVRTLSEFSTHFDISEDFRRDSVDTILLYLYGKCGKIDKSKEMFDKITERGGTRRSLLPWNTMIGCYTQNSRPLEALTLFRSMIAGSNPKPNHVTMVNVLSSCAQVGDLELGCWVHELMEIRGSKNLIKTNTILATAFIDMYSKCGDPKKANGVFCQIVTKDVVSFNAMIIGLAINGEGREALKLFTEMEEIGVRPNASTFLGILSACSHTGLVDEGRQLFRDMCQKHLLSPELEHYSCYIDLLARFGHVKEALNVVSSMEIEPNSFVWGTLLVGCQLDSRPELAMDISTRVFKADPNDSGGYVMLSNLYAKDQRWGEILELRRRMKERGVKKQPGCSWIRINGGVHEFHVGSTSHPEIQMIYCTLDGLFNEMSSLSYY